MFEFMRALVMATLALALLPAGAQPANTNVLRLVVPYPPGASTDMVGRLLAQKMGDSLGRTVIVENRGGASGNIGSDMVAKSAPDGNTLLLGTDATHSANYHLFRNLPFNPIKDFTPITMVARNVIVLVANPSLPVSNMTELIAYAKAHPGKLSYGSSGAGSPHHLAGALLNQSAGIDLVHVPYKGGGPAVTDVLGGQIPLAFCSLVSVAQQIKAGSLKALGVTDLTAYAGLPGVPAIADTVPGFEMTSWLALFAPANLPAATLAQMHDAAVAALKSPDVSAKLEAAGLVPVGDSAAAFAKRLKDDFDKRGALIKASGITLD
jgi:tripartite-type tricarboxylate transporter receptor subunit TctC